MTQIPREIVGISYTNVERRMMEALAMGNAVTADELRKCLVNGDNDRLNSIQVQVSNIRKKLVTTRYRIFSGQEGGELTYRLTVFLSSAKS